MLTDKQAKRRAAKVAAMVLKGIYEDGIEWIDYDADCDEDYERCERATRKLIKRLKRASKRKPDVPKLLKRIERRTRAPRLVTLSPEAEQLTIIDEATAIDGLTFERMAARLGVDPTE